MKITGIHVEGFGLLRDVTVNDVSPNLTVIHGPNEAGKSTLLDFLRGVLFGYPNRRQHLPLHEPLFGGRHGGSLQVVDNAGDAWRISRYNDAGRLELASLDGSVADPELLRKLLGGADDKLFRAVFAFGLGELSNFATLDSEEVRDRVFSAGVLGAGRSATLVARALEKRAGELVRPKQKGAKANALRDRLSEIKDDLRTARQLSEGYGEAQAEFERLRTTASLTALEIEALRRRSNEIDLLRTCWPATRRAVEARSQLVELGETTAAQATLLSFEPEIRQLVAEQSGNRERLQQFNEQSNQRNSIDRDISSLQQKLGTDIDAIGLESTLIGIEARDSAVSLEERHRDLRAAEGALDGEVRRAADEVAESTARYAQALGQHPARVETELREQLELLESLKGFVADRDRRIADDASAARDRAVELLAANKNPRRRRPLAQIIGFSLFCGALGFLAVILASHHDLAEAFVVLVAAIAIFAGGLLRQRELEKEEADEAAPNIEKPVGIPHEKEIAALTRQLHLGNGPLPAEIDALAHRITEERDNRRNLDELLRSQETAERLLDSCRRRTAQHQESMENVEQAAADKAKELGFGAGLSPSRLVEAIDALRRINDLSAAKKRISEKLGALEIGITRFQNRLSSIVDQANMEISDLFSVNDISLALEELTTRLVALQGDEAVRRDAKNTILQSTEDVQQSLGLGADADRLRNELISARVLEWEAEREQLFVQIEECTKRYQEEIAEQHDAAGALSLAAQSDEIARLELERESIEEDLDAALTDWAVLSVAQSLLSRTLDRYEQDRQPVVIARAAELFLKVTDGRYVNLVARQDDDGHHHGIAALTRTGSRIDAMDLSRGTAEQLYLCLRLAFAITFAERAVSLPLILDDVLVNFDPERAMAVAQAVSETAVDHQVIAFTCHPHVVEYFRTIDPEVSVLRLDELTAVSRANQ